MAEINVNDVYAALGIEAPSQQPEAADPAGQGEKEPSSTGTDGRKQAADAAENESQNTAGADRGAEDLQQTEATASPSADKTEGEGAEHTDAEKTGGDNSRTMTRAERAEQARLRREREQQAAVDAAVRAERERGQAELKVMFEAAGMVDRYHDNRPITSMEEFRAFEQARESDRLSRQLQEGRLTPETLQQAVDRSPAVQAAKAAVERLEANQREQEQQKNRAEFDRRVKEELEEIHKLNPSVSTLEEILALPTGDAFARYVRENGLSFLDAFKLANADQMAKAQAMAAREGEVRQAQSKGHLRSIVSPAGGVTSDVPRQTVQLYRDLHPDWSMEQIRQDYAKRMK